MTFFFSFSKHFFFGGSWFRSRLGPWLVGVGWHIYLCVCIPIVAIHYFLTLAVQNNWSSWFWFTGRSKKSKAVVSFGGITSKWRDTEVCDCQVNGQPPTNHKLSPLLKRERMKGKRDSFFKKALKRTGKTLIPKKTKPINCLETEEDNRRKSKKLRSLAGQQLFPVDMISNKFQKSVR